MSFHLKSWKVRTPSGSIGYIEYTTIPNWPGKKPKPKASSGPRRRCHALFRSLPDGMPVFDGAMYVNGYAIAAAPLCGTER